MKQQRSELTGPSFGVLLAGFLGTMCGASPLPFNVLGFLFEPLNKEFGWDRTQVSLGITIFGITAALLAPVFGWFSDKYGVRRVALWSLVAFIVSFSAFYVMPGSLAAFYLLWFLVGLVGIGSTPVTWSRAISMWFVKNRGLALGMMLLGTSAAAFIVPKIAEAAIRTSGWREMFPTVALLPLLVALPICFLLFREPREHERQTALSTADGKLVGMTFGEAVRTRQFWLLWISILLIALAYGGAHIHMPSIVKDHGLDSQAAAGIMGIVGIGLMIGRLGVGFLLDRIWGPLVAFPVLCLPAIGCYLLMGTHNDGFTIELPTQLVEYVSFLPAMISISFIAIAAFLLGFAAGAESDLIAFLAARYFGMAHFGRIYGMLYMPFGLFSAISPVVYGIVRDQSGSYDGVLSVESFVFILGGALLLLLGRYPDLAAQKEAA